MKEFDCKVSSTWSNDDCKKDAAFTHRKHGDGGQEKVSQLDVVIGAKRGTITAICHEGKVWDSWGSLPDLREDSGRKRCGTILRDQKKELVWMGTQDGGT